MGFCGPGRRRHGDFAPLECSMFERFWPVRAGAEPSGHAWHRSPRNLHQKSAPGNRLKPFGHVPLMRTQKKTSNESPLSTVCGPHQGLCVPQNLLLEAEIVHIIPGTKNGHKALHIFKPMLDRLHGSITMCVAKNKSNCKQAKNCQKRFTLTESSPCELLNHD